MQKAKCEGSFFEGCSTKYKGIPKYPYGYNRSAVTAVSWRHRKGAGSNPRSLLRQQHNLLANLPEFSRVVEKNPQ